MKEKQVYIVPSSVLSSPRFGLMTTNEEVEIGKEMPVGSEIKFMSEDSSLGDRFMAKAIARNEVKKGKNVLLVVPKGTDVKY